MNLPPANNLLYFPKVPVRDIPQSLDEVIKKVSNNRKTHADHLAGMIFIEVLRICESEGFIQTQDNSKDMVLAFESIKSLMYKTIGQPHPLQMIASDNIELLESIDDGE